MVILAVNINSPLSFKAKTAGYIYNFKNVIMKFI